MTERAKCPISGKDLFVLKRPVMEIVADFVPRPEPPDPLKGLTEREKGFVRAVLAARLPEDRDLFNVLADYLEEERSQATAQRFRDLAGPDFEDKRVMPFDTSQQVVANLVQWLEREGHTREAHAIRSLIYHLTED